MVAMKCLKSLKKVFILIFVFTFVFSIVRVGKVFASEPLFKLTNAKISEKNDGVKANIVSFSDNNVEINAEFHKLNDYIIYELTIKNNTDKNYTIKSITDNNDNRYVSYLYDNYQGVEVKANDSITITVKSVYQNEVTDITKRDQEDTLKLSLVLVDENGNIAGEDIYINPKTNDNVMLYVIVSITSLAAILSIVIIQNKKSKRLLILVICLTPFVVKAVKSSIVITINNEIRLLDKVVQTTDVLGEKVTTVLPYGSKVTKPSDPQKEGYTFVGWFNGDEEFDFDKEYTDDVVLTAKFNLVTYNISYILDDGVETTNPLTYTVESDDITLNAPKKEDYNFAGWTGSNGTELQTRVTIYKGSTGDKNYVAHYSIIEDATYYVIHQYKNLDGTYEINVETLTGVAKTDVYPAIIPRTGFIDPTVQMLTIKGDGTASITYTYERVPVALSYSDTDKIDLENSSEAKTYEYGTLVTVIAKDIVGLDFVKWNDDSTDQTHSFNITSDITMSPQYKTKEYTVSFNSNGGSNVSNMYVEHGSALTSFPTDPTNGDLVFMGWYKDESLTEKGSVNDVITSNVTYYAKWQNILCKRASSLHSIECDKTSLGCYDDGYHVGGSKNTNTITFGKLNTTSTLTSGDAFDCDVNGDNVYNPLTERFYYLRTDENNNAVFIYSNNFANDEPDSSIIVPYNENGDLNLGPVTVYQYLPSASNWNNTELYSTPRQLLTEKGNTTTPEGELVSFGYDGKSSRIVSTQDLVAACGINPTNARTGELSNCNYLLENTKYHEGYPYRQCYWTETVRDNDVKVFRVAGEERFVGYTNPEGNAGARPVIEVPLKRVDNGELDSYIITLAPNGGSINLTTYLINKGDKLGDIPTPTYDGKLFDGWFTSKTGGTIVNEDTIPTSDVTYYARWSSSINSATIDTNMTVAIGSDKYINVTGPSDMEEYTFTSLDTNVVTVDSNGLLSGVTVGTTKVIVKGTRSNIEKEVNIEVNANNLYTIHLDENGGSDVNDIVRAFDETLGNLPEPEMPDMVFDGWYTAKNGGTEVTKDTVVTGEVTYYAHYKDFLCKKAITLHTEECVRTSGGCYAAGYRTNGSKGTKTITYGTNVQNNTLTAGNAFTCDVNGDGIFDEDTERFYYLTTDSNNISSLVYYNSYDNTNGSESITCNAVGNYNAGGEYYLGPVTAATVLPTTTNWSNTKLYTNPRQIRSETGEETIGSGNKLKNLAVFDYGNAAARLLTTQEVEAACGFTVGNSTTGELRVCEYLLENTRYKDQSACRYGYYLETPVSSGSNVFRVSGENAFVGHGQATSDTGSRPVIEVPTKYIKYIDKTIYTLTLDPGAGASVDPTIVKVEDGKVINYLPTPLKTNYIFDGWYDGNTLVKAGDTVDSSKTLTAKWIANITTATITPSNVSVMVGETVQLSITGSSELENYNIVSENASIASIDGNNVITGAALGSTNIIITGETSGETVIIPVDVSPEQVTVTYIYNDGVTASTVDTISKGSSVSSIPSISRSTYYFDGWHIGSIQGELFTTSNIVNTNITVYAKWIPTISQATVTPNSLELTVNEPGLNSAQLSISTVTDMEEYTIISSNSAIASATSEGLVTAISEGSATITYEGSLSHETIEIPVVVHPEIIRHTITFVAPGYSVDPIIVIEGETLDQSDIAELSKANTFFRGWFTLENGEGDKLTTSTTFDSDKTYYAYFENIVCKASSELRKTKCASKSNGGCLKDGYTTSDYITFGSLVSGNNLAPGNAFDCDVNGDGLYNPDTERFYYLRTDEKDNAVLLFSYNTVKDNGVLKLDSDASVAYSSVNNTTPNLAYLPTTSDWSNVSLSNPSHKQIYSNNTEGPDVDYTGYAGRMATIDDLADTECNTTSYVIKSKHCEYIYDNTGYVIESNRSYWLEIPVKSSNNLFRAAGSNRNIGTAAYTNDTGAGVRPVIEVPLTKIDTEINPTFFITLDANGGELISNVLVIPQGSALTNLVDPQHESYQFDGWFIDGTDTRVTSETIPTKSILLVARWSYNASDEIVEFRTTNDAMKEYYAKIDTWKNSSSNFPSWNSNNKSPNWALDASENTVMMQNFVNNSCECNDNQCTSSGSIKCDKPKGYETGFTESVTVRLSDASTKTKTGSIVSYAYSSNGVIYNLIPGEVYYWELDSDPNVYGYVKFTSERRILEAGDVRNVRDLGGIPVDSDNNGTIDGHIAYGRLFRGTRLVSGNSAAYLTDLGINKELDLREANSDNKMSSYTRVEAQNYYVNPLNYAQNPNSTTETEYNYYIMTRNAVKKAMQMIVEDDSANVFFHCRIGTDRTGTVAWVLEGLLGVPEEERIRDYELSFFYGLVRIHRYHDEKPGSNVGTGKERFVYMHNFMASNSDIYNWYMYGTDNQQADEDLINAFRSKMIVND